MSNEEQSLRFLYGRNSQVATSIVAHRRNHTIIDGTIKVTHFSANSLRLETRNNIAATLTLYSAKASNNSRRFAFLFGKAAALFTAKTRNDSHTVVAAFGNNRTGIRYGLKHVII